jgi:hypothetical protein
MKIQIIGAFTALGPRIATPLFKKVQETLELLGHEVHNPCEMTSPETIWGDAMKITLDNLPAMDAVFVMDNFVISPGSLLEIRDSVKHGLKFYNEKHRPPQNPSTRNVDLMSMTRDERREYIHKLNEQRLKESELMNPKAF